MVVGKRSRDNGMIGKAGGFAVFPSYEIGHKALIDLLLNEYGNFNLLQLMAKFAPSFQNNTKKYIQSIKKNTGVDEKVLIRKYTKVQFEQIWKTIELIESWKLGIIKEFSMTGEITRVKKDKKGKILSYLVDGIGWLSKKEAIELALRKKINAVVVTRRGSTFLRSKPNKTIIDNLENKA